MNPSSADRTAIFGKLRQRLAPAGDDPARRSAVAARLAHQAPHLIPERVTGRDPEQLLALFRGFLEGQSATVIEVATAADVPGAVAGYLRANNLPARLRVGDDAYLSQLPWEHEPQLERLRGHATADDEVGLTHALAAVAETGTLVHASGPDNPVTLNFLPETSIAVLRAADLTGAYETAWERVRSRFGRGGLPRTINFVSGPSRTADIGGKLVTGAHGPRRLCVVVVKAP